MWNPLILQPHHDKHRISILLALQTYPWVTSHCKISVMSSEECHNPDMGQNQILHPTWPQIQGARVWGHATLRSKFNPPLFSLVLSNRLRFGVPRVNHVLQTGLPCISVRTTRDANTEIWKKMREICLTVYWIMNSWVTGGWVTDGVLLGVVSSHVLLRRKEQFKPVILGMELKWDHEFGSEFAGQKPQSNSLSCCM